MPNQSKPELELTFEAAGNVTRRRAVTFSGAQVTIAGAKVLGVSPDDVTNGDHGVVVASGPTIVEAGGAFAVGASLIADANGRAVASSGALSLKAGATAVTSTAANGAVLSGGEMPEHVFADALAESSGAGALVEVLLRR